MRAKQQDYGKEYYTALLYRETENSQRNQARLKLFRERLANGHRPATEGNESCRMLEVGCGQGGFLRLAQEAFDVEGIDISRSAVSMLRDQFGERVRAANVEQQPLPRGRYAAIAAFNVLEHLKYPEKSVGKLYDALLPGGLLIGSVPNKQGAVGLPLTALTNLFDRTHVSTFAPNIWQRIFQHAGFEPVEFFGEITFGHNHCRYLTGRWWRQISFNLMFACRRPGKAN